MTTVQTLKGFRDFLPEEKRKRDAVAQTMRGVYERFGFAPIETPTLEYAELLLGKYGDEADKLVYKFTDRGDREVALRYDQTVPTARILAQYQSELPRFFRRYQIQNVFRADKPQRGRYREFTQSDADIFGSTSPLADAEILAVFYNIYVALGLSSLVIEINDRQTLFNTLGVFTNPNLSVFSICQSIDKLDKQPPSEVAAELIAKGMTVEQTDQLFVQLKNATTSDELQTIVDITVGLGVPRQALKLNPNLVRGLDYYTGMIFEGRIPEYTVGSIGGGGRYNNLINDLSGLEMPAVGFGIGFDRTVEAAEQLGALNLSPTATKVLVTVFDETTMAASLAATQQLREAGIATELYPAIDKLGKQFKLADQKNIPFAVVIGQEEIDKNVVTVKNLKDGSQTQTTVMELATQLAE